MKMRKDLFICLALAAVTLGIFWPVTQADFISFDDPDYVTANVHVQNGLTPENFKWALVNPVSSNWHPLTMYSHMLDCQLYGLEPWGHHLTSLLLHTFNTVLAFLFLRRVTGAVWRSALAAILFGWHPLRVESVAWVAERKDVLSTFFFLLTLLVYAKAVTGDGWRVAGKAVGRDSRNTQHATRWYWLSLACFALGLMSKPMVVTLPFVLLLLDYWPLGRFKTGRGRALVIEKIPFFLLALASSVVTFVVQQRGGSVMTVENFPLDIRVENAVISYCRYLGKIFWPTDLAIFYPHPGHWPWENVVGAVTALCAISTFLWLRRKQYPYGLMGWLWFVGTLVPAIGVVQVGGQSIADRYTYIPSLGVLISTIWGAAELARRMRNGRAVWSAVGMAAIILCVVSTREQLAFWKNGETLFRHALAVTRNNYVAHGDLGVTLFNEGRIDEAIPQFQETIRLRPDYADARANLGVALLNKNRIDEAINEFQEAIRMKPDDGNAHYNFGVALFKKARLDEAIGQFQEAIRLNPDDADARNRLATALELKNRFDALSSDPVALNNLAWELATSQDASVRNGPLAVKLAERACELTHYQVAIAVGTLAAAYAEAGRFDEAVATAQKACTLASDPGQKDLLQKNQELLELYRQGKSYHQTSPAAKPVPSAEKLVPTAP